MEKSKEKITFDGFSFTYKESDNFGVHDINLTYRRVNLLY